MRLLDVIKKYSLFSFSPVISAVIQLVAVFIIGHVLSGQELGLAGIYSTMIFILVFISDGGSSSYFIYRKILCRNNVLIINLLNIAISLFFVLFYVLYATYNNYDYVILTAIGFLVTSVSITLPLYTYARFLVEKQFNKLALIELISKGVFLASLTLLVYIFNLQSLSVVAAWAISFIVRLILFVLLARTIQLYESSEENDHGIQVISKWWRYIKNQIMSQCLNYTVLTSDVFLISHFGGLDKVGIYSLCKDATLKISSVISPVIGKLLVSHVVNIEREQIVSIYKKVFVITFALSFSVFGLWALTGGRVLEFLRPGLSDEAALYIYAWSACGVLRMLINPITSIFQAVGETDKELKINIVSFLAYFLLVSMSYMFVNDVVYVIVPSLVLMYFVSFGYSSLLLQRFFVGIHKNKR